MVVKISIYTEATGKVEGVLTEDQSPQTVEAIINALPIESAAQRWGDEVYFTTPVTAEEEDPVSTVEKGTIAFWPAGNAICIFWGPTPMSPSPDEIRPASPVNLIGTITGDPSVFSNVDAGTTIRIERVE